MNKLCISLTALLVAGTTVLAADKKIINLPGKGGPGNGNNGVVNQNQNFKPQVINQNQNFKPQVIKTDGKKPDFPKVVDADKKKVDDNKPDFKKVNDKKLDDKKVVDGNKQVLDFKKIDFKNPDFKQLPKLNDIDKKILGDKLQNVNQQGTQNNLLKLSPKIQLNNYQQKFGVKKSFGYCYQGFDHCHWTYCCWWGPSNCYCYWCPCTTVYYYWCVPDQCWYPISYCPYGVYYW
ncbi:MAG: hypothetical protein JNM56_38830 [Planctomycetia bacterium]|nr:hypothetical protein [Planctomycetia bacterium]